MTLMSFGAAVALHASKRPRDVALSCGDEYLTWQELDARTNMRARWFSKLGVRPDDLVTTVMPNSIEYFEVCIAIWKLGATPQPISVQLSKRERDEVLTLADPSLIVGLDPGEAGERKSVPFGSDVPEGLSFDPLPDQVSKRWKAPTSGGSTGRPKLVLATQPALIDPDEGMTELGLRPTARQLLVAPLHHNAPFVVAMRGLLSGGQVTIVPRFDPSETLEKLEKAQVNWVMLVPTMMHRIIRLESKERNRDFSSLEAVFHVGGPCAPWLKRAWIDWLGPERIFELYGGTEAQATTIITGSEWLEHPGSVGHPGKRQLSSGTPSALVNTIEVMGPNLEPIERGEVGDIWMRIDQASPTYEYVGAEPLRVGEWESIGDLGWFDEGGYLYISDRRSDMIVSGGANVYPAEVEAQLLEHPAVDACVVIGLPDEDLGYRVHALVQMSDDTTESELRAFLGERLARYKIPRTFEWVNDVPRDAAGKIRRRTLVEARLDMSTGL
jgi:bile acid-coenzyme A ligase